MVLCSLIYLKPQEKQAVTKCQYGLDCSAQKNWVIVCPPGLTIVGNMWENKFWLFERNLSHSASARQLNKVKKIILYLFINYKAWKGMKRQRWRQILQPRMGQNVLPSVWHVSSSWAIFLAGWREKTEQSPDYRLPGSSHSHIAWAVGGTWRPSDDQQINTI